MKKIKYIIIILCIIVIVLILMILANKKIQDKENYIDLSNNVVEGSIENIGYSDFFTVSSCISQYLDIINKNNSSYYGRDRDGNRVLAVTKEQVSNSIIGILSEYYKKEENIDSSNVFTKIRMLDEKNVLVLTKVYKINEGNVIPYVAEGFTTTINYEYIRDVNFIVNLDTINKTYSVEELGKKVDKDIKREQIDRIEKNTYNGYYDYYANEEDIIKKHVEAYKRIMLANQKLAYEYLDKEYREKKFGSLEKFQNYIKEHEEEITTLTMKKYKVNTTEDGKEYIIIDSNGNYYRFCENNVMDYTVMLDVYTIDLPEFLEEFNNGDESKKVGLCIERFLQMINAEDYESAYNLLDDTFKQNNFKTLDEFTEYIQENFNYTNNLKSIDSLKKEGKYYICTVSIENAKFPLNEPIQRSFVIKFEEGTGFKMSIKLD